MRNFIKIWAVLVVIFGGGGEIFAQNLGQNENWEAIYNAKRGEILAEYEKIDSEKQEFEAYKAAMKSLFDEREAALNAREADINRTLELVSQKERYIENLVAKNEQILNDLNATSNEKVLQVYEKMKDAPAAAILSTLPREEAVAILQSLNPKKISSILAKIDPLIAAELTTKLRNNENNATQTITP